MRKLFSLILVLSLCFSLVACQGNDKPAPNKETGKETSKEANKETTAAEEKSDAQELSVDNPIIVDKEAKEIRLLAQIDGQFTEKSTMHGVVFVDGGQGKNTMFRSLAKQDLYYDALKELGFTAGDTTNADNADKEPATGDKLEIRFQWDDKDVSLDEMVIDSTGEKFDIRFTGNKEASDKFQSGCIVCLTTCYVGITTNAAHLLGAEPNDVSFKLNPEVAPEDGTQVTVVIRAAK